MCAASPAGKPHVPSPVAAFTARVCVCVWGGAFRKAFGKLCKLGLPFRNPEVIPEWDERGQGSLGRAKAQGVTMAGAEKGGEGEVKS